LHVGNFKRALVDAFDPRSCPRWTLGWIGGACRHAFLQRLGKEREKPAKVSFKVPMATGS
jgi:hypothetical protein